MSMIQISNKGAEIVDTNFWTSEYARHGYAFLSANAGVLRLLIPPALEYVMPDIRTGTRVEVEPGTLQGRAVWNLVFEDGTDSPFVLSIGEEQMDRTMTAGSCRLTVWTTAGRQLDVPCEVRA